MRWPRRRSLVEEPQGCPARHGDDGTLGDAPVTSGSSGHADFLTVAPHWGHGYELQFFTNHIGHFILVTGLLDRLTDDGRVVMLSSEGHTMAPKAGIELDNLNGQRGYGDLKMYGQSKLANLLFAKELSRRFAGTKRTANAVHPGVIATNLGRHLNPVMRAAMSLAGPLAMKTIAQGAATQVYAATQPSLRDVTGWYFASSDIAKPRKDANDAELARKLWEASEKIAAEVTAAS